MRPNKQSNKKQIVIEREVIYYRHGVDAMELSREMSLAKINYITINYKYRKRFASHSRIKNGLYITTVISTTKVEDQNPRSKLFMHDCVCV